MDYALPVRLCIFIFDLYRLWFDMTCVDSPLLLYPLSCWVPVNMADGTFSRPVFKEHLDTSPMSILDGLMQCRPPIKARFFH